MATASARPPTPPSGARPPLRRDTGRGVVAGVCAGLAARWRVDPLLVRLGFIAAALAGGIGIALYVLALDDDSARRPGRGGAGAAGSWEPRHGGGRARRRPPAPERAARLPRARVSGSRTRWCGRWCSWRPARPSCGASRAAATRLSRLARSPRGRRRSQLRRRPPQPRAAAPSAPTRAPRTAPSPATADTVRERAKLVSRTSLGIALVIAAGLAFLQATGSLDAAGDALTAVLVVVIVLGVIFAPWVTRMGRSLTAERAERIRSQERAEMAAHLHDSVLQTLAMVQRRADNPREVSSLARRQERELRVVALRQGDRHAHPAAARRGAGGGGPGRRDGSRDPGRGGHGRRCRARRAGGGARGGRTRGDGERGQVRRRLAGGGLRRGLGRACAGIRQGSWARASTRTGSRPIGAASASRSSAAWSATEAGRG